MNKKFIEKIDQIFSVLKNGNQDEIKNAKRELEKLWYADRKTFKKHARLALAQLKEFDAIKNPKNQAAFVAGLSLFYLILSDTDFRELKNFTLKVICHPNGHVREHMRRTADWLYISLSSRINPFVHPRSKKISQKQITEQSKAKEEFAEYLRDIETLLEKYDDGSYDHVEYIDQLRPSVYKSLQLLWQNVTRVNQHRNLHTPPLDMLEKRTEIKRELSAFIQSTKSSISLEEIENIIYEETDYDALNDAIYRFHIASPHEFQNIAAILNDAWNYFPHRVLGGLCPAEVINHHQPERLVN